MSLDIKMSKPVTGSGQRTGSDVFQNENLTSGDNTSDIENTTHRRNDITEKETNVHQQHMAATHTVGARELYKTDKQVQTFISGDFFVNTANIYSGHLVE
ncbi:hypothetical protein ACF0H5_019520 [Mactra antiquata]